MKRKLIAFAAIALALSACTGSSDPYYEAFKGSEWDGAAYDFDTAEGQEFLEEMAAELCAEMVNQFQSGATDEESTFALLRMIDGSNPTADHAVLALEAVLDHRCDASQPDGLKSR